MNGFIRQQVLVPIGTVISFMGTKAPAGWLVCDGTEYQTKDYPEFVEYLTEQFGDLNYFGGGDETFCVPDLRGEFLRGSGTGYQTGPDAGIHQEPTKHVSILHRTNNAIYLGGLGKQLLYSNVDSVENSISGRTIYNASTSDKLITTHPGSYYTAHPTNTGVLYIIKAKHMIEE